MHSAFLDNLQSMTMWFDGAELKNAVKIQMNYMDIEGFVQFYECMPAFLFLLTPYAQLSNITHTR